MHRLPPPRNPTTLSSPCLRAPTATGALRQGLAVQLGRSVARQLEALMMVATETPAWWAAALPATPAHTAAGNPQW